MDKIICKMMECLPVTLEERNAVVEDLKARIANGERGDDVPIVMEVLGCDYESAHAAVVSGDKDAVMALLDEGLKLATEPSLPRP